MNELAAKEENHMLVDLEKISSNVLSDKKNNSDIIPSSVGTGPLISFEPKERSPILLRLPKEGGMVPYSKLFAVGGDGRRKRRVEKHDRQHSPTTYQHRTDLDAPVS